jgi:hypothetical protein
LRRLKVAHGPGFNATGQDWEHGKTAFFSFSVVGAAVLLRVIQERGHGGVSTGNQYETETAARKNMIVKAGTIPLKWAYGMAITEGA